MSELIYKTAAQLSESLAKKEVSAREVTQAHLDQITKVDKATAGNVTDGIDAKSKLLIPGLVDLHTHLREPGFEQSETVLTGTQAAAMGGFTAVHAMANTSPVADTAGVVEQVLAQPPAGHPWLLNVNIPSSAQADDAPWTITRLGRRHASFPAVAQANPRGDLFYWIGPAGEAREDGEGTDFHAIRQGQVSITPLKVDMTDHQHLPTWQRWLEPR